MKTQLLKSGFIMACVLFCITAYAQDKTKKTDLKGIWTYSLPDAPYGYQDGTIEFKNTDSKITANVKMGDSSSTVNINEIKKNKDDYTCSLYVDGSDVKVTFKPEAEKITGIVVAEGQEMPITLTPQKK